MLFQGKHDSDSQRIRSKSSQNIENLNKQKYHYISKTPRLKKKREIGSINSSPIFSCCIGNITPKKIKIKKYLKESGSQQAVLELDKTSKKEGELEDASPNPSTMKSSVTPRQVNPARSCRKGPGLRKMPLAFPNNLPLRTTLISDIRRPAKINSAKITKSTTSLTINPQINLLQYTSPVSRPKLSPSIPLSKFSCRDSAIN